MKRAILLALVLFTAGCQAQTQFRIAAVTELGEAFAQLERGTLESQVGLLTRCDMREEQARFAATNDLKGIATDPDYDDAAKEGAITAKMEQLQKVMGDIDLDRARGTERSRRMAQWTAHGRWILTHMLTLERQNQTTDQQLAEYRVLAEDYARRLFGLVPERPHPIGEGDE